MWPNAFRPPDSKMPCSSEAFLLPTPGGSVGQDVGGQSSTADLLVGYFFFRGTFFTLLACL